MAYKVIILYQLYMPSYFLGTFTEYPYKKRYFSSYSNFKGYKSYNGWSNSETFVSLETFVTV